MYCMHSIQVETWLYKILRRYGMKNGMCRILHIERRSSQVFLALYPRLVVKLSVDFANYYCGNLIACVYAGKD